MKSFFKFAIVVLFAIVTSSCTVCSCTESWDRMVKDMSSDYGGGLHRRVTVYDYNGEVIKS